MPSLTALDLFAGTGWGVACQRLGILEEGVEIMPEAVATREANGMTTIYNDVWEGLDDEPREYDLLIASPPCQTFSMAGKGAGRRALDDVLKAIAAEAYKDPAALRVFGEAHDPRTALVLTPLAHVWRDRPRFVAMEQVPAVLPVWEACGRVMREWGYSVDTAVLNAEQYGVPQTRKRAILVARLDGPVALPAPTHSRYYSSDPERLDNGVLPWQGVRDVLGCDVPGATFTANNKLTNQARRPLSHPAPTITAGHDSGNRGILAADGLLTVATVDVVAAIQTYPEDFAWRGAKTKQLLQIGNAVPPLLAEAILRALTA
ncbi:DNA cytosine methyltransferase [Pseudarthrobacter scleromae]|uniref:DNA cytosine methyltransferase n=1 Tax=Pseudarthrobacter scleromae TaxID=158897 RepID=UPI003627659D